MQPEILKEHVDALGISLKELEDTVNTRLSHIDLKSIRPRIKPTSDTMETGALASYIRKGDTSLVEKALSSAADEGGVLIPTHLQEGIVRALSTPQSIRGLARVVAISTDALELLVDREDLDAGWVQEKGERPETQASKLAKIKIPVHEVYAKPRATQKLLDDAQMDVESWISQKISDKFSKIENTAFLLGDGQNKPKGILTYPTAPADAPEWGHIQTFTTGKVGGFSDDEGANVLFDMISAMKSQYLEKAVWVMSRSAHLAIRKLTDSNGQYLWQPGLGLGSQQSLLGYPVVILDEMPGLSDQNASKSVLFINLNEAYTIVDRQEIQVLRDPYSAKPYVEFYATKRVGGDIVNFDALKLLSFE